MRPWQRQDLTARAAFDTMNRVLEGGAQMDLTGLSTDELHRRAIAARQVNGASEVTLMFLLAELEDREVYREYGCSSIAHYAQFHLRLDARKARELARLGRVMHTLPRLLDAFARGEME
ncbi:MAG: hypothetical protein ACYCW6_26050 [Candidatus Xenobia bacterium]